MLIAKYQNNIFENTALYKCVFTWFSSFLGPLWTKLTPGIRVRKAVICPKLTWALVSKFF
jgi:hypothetical protein